MPWFQAGLADKDSLIKFLKTSEYNWTNFSDYLKEIYKSRKLFKVKDIIFVKKENRKAAAISGAAMCTKYGLFLPALLEAESENDTHGINRIHKIAGKRVYSAMGRSQSLEFFNSLYAEYCETRVDYQLLTLAKPVIKPDKPAVPGLEIEKCSIDDIGRLYPIHKAYEIEEVLLDPKKYNPSLSYYVLQKSLMHHLVFAATLQGTPIARAATNARGFHWDQLGGIYTERQYRNKGISSYLVYGLISEIQKQSRNVCLFVKEDNKAAIRVYKKLGFQEQGPFQIRYFSHDSDK